MRRVLFALSLVSVCAWGQRAISAHSGMVNYVEGSVTLDDKPLDPKFTELPEVKNRSELATTQGRAEVLLTPGAFLRLAENSSFRMISNMLSDTRVEVVTGSAVVEIDEFCWNQGGQRCEMIKGNTITMQYGDAQVALLKKGLYRVDAGDPGTLRVYEGEARVTLNGDGVTARKGRQVDLGAVLSASNFDPKDDDAFYRWNARRAEYIATANVSSARSASGSGFVGSGFGPSQWAWNPWYGMFTFVPGFGYGYSPFGWYYYSPITVGYLYPPAYGYGFGGGGLPGGVVGSRTVAPQRGSLGASTVTPRAVVGPRAGGGPVGSTSSFDLGASAAPARGGLNGAGSSGGSSGGGFSGGGGGGGAVVSAHGGGGGARGGR